VSVKIKVLAIIQARTGSTRLPGKVLNEIEGKTVLEHVVQRVRAARLVNEVIVATTINKDDLAIVKLCAELGVRIFCGSENDVLDRFYQAARLYEAEHIVRITSDCPLMDPAIIDQVIALHLQDKADYTSNVLKETFPDGEDIEVMTFTALKKAWLNARLTSEREHVTPFIINNPKLFKYAVLEYKENLSAKRWTLDNQEDLLFIKEVYRRLYRSDKLFGMEEVMKVLKAEPELEKLNHHIARNEGLAKSLREDRMFAATEENING
jgi:spore coat polysaccharide biosynthesis protein SpsF (cytidylyltransferase family)